MIKESYIILIVIFWIFNQLTIGIVLQSQNQVDQHIHYHSKIIIDPKYPQCKITCKSSFCEVTRGEMQEEVTGSCFLPPYRTSCGGLPQGCESCVEACGFKDNTKKPSTHNPFIPSLVSGKKKFDNNSYTDQAMENPDIQVGHFR